MNASKTAAGKVDPPPFIGWLVYFSVSLVVSTRAIHNGIHPGGSKYRRKV